MSDSKERAQHCPHCGKPLDRERFPVSTSFWDVLSLAVVVSGVVAIIVALKG